MIASGQSQSNSTYFPNVGYRGHPGYVWEGEYVGSWGNNGSTPHSSSYDITSSNVLSIWLTDM